MNASGLWQSAAGLFDAGLRRARHAFGYDAVDTGEGKRRAPSGITRSEDDELPIQKRRKLLSQTRDLARNFALLAWAIRQHLNSITTFNFQPKTGTRSPLDQSNALSRVLCDATHDADLLGFSTVRPRAAVQSRRTLPQRFGARL